MRRFVDLHTHSTFSDGTLTPEQLIRFADRARLAAVALTDHDTTGGLGEARLAAADTPRLRFIPGVEISAKFPTGTLQIRGPGVDEEASGLRGMLEGLREARDERNPRIIARLRQLGLEITMGDGRAAARAMRGGRSEPVLGRMHIAEALRRKGCVKSTAAAFGRYIGDGGPAYVDKERLSPRQAISAIRGSGGIAVLAHPAQLRCANRAQLERTVRELVDAGLGGIEVYHSDHAPDQVRLYLRLARRYGLTVTGGSDFHGASKPGVSLGRPRVPLAAVAAGPGAGKLLPVI